MRCEIVCQSMEQQPRSEPSPLLLNFVAGFYLTIRAFLREPLANPICLKKSAL